MALSVVLEYLDFFYLPLLQQLNKRFYNHLIPQASEMCQIKFVKTKIYNLQPDDKLYELSAQSIEFGQNWMMLPFKKLNFEFSTYSRYAKVIQIDARFVFFISGMDEYDMCSTPQCYAYDIQDNSLISIPDIKFPRNSFGITFIKGLIYVIGGIEMGTNTTTKETEVYDIFNCKWKTWIPIPCAKIGISAVQLKNRYIYLVGGLNNQSNKHTKNRQFLDKFLMIDTLNEAKGWQKIRIKKDVRIPNGCQFGVLPYNTPNEDPSITHFLILGGVNKDLYHDVYDVTVKENSKYAYPKLLPWVLEEQDRFYFNQSFQSNLLDYCQEKYIVGRMAAYKFTFSHDLTEIVEMNNFQEAGHFFNDNGAPFMTFR
ncbi:kelch motif family protein [Stylonychia lemnae]|uniref:Kelch motif family protein n=1 Tax=Stylonychia lemnae TaxID=5949 RepID=A0A077ZUQ3_STYLE|nr:kelch motif family protein [Stylonychia lemnae]|eukprot:CDW72181.1 kelch motif family protein [Stylonychia lemnae]